MDAVLFTPTRLIKPLILECWGGPADGQLMTVAPNTIARSFGESDGWIVEPYAELAFHEGGYYEVHHRWDKGKGNRGLVLKWIP